MKTFEELKQEAIAKGIKPGAVIKSAMPSDMTVTTVPDYSEWSQGGCDPNDIVRKVAERLKD